MKDRNRKETIATIWEWTGLISIALLVVFPNGKTAIDTIVEKAGVVQSAWGRIGYASLTMMGLFVLVYFTSLKWFAKEKCTKWFTVAVSGLMVVTILSLMVFR